MNERNPVLVSAHAVELTHRITVDAQPQRVFDLVADTAGAPRFAPSQVHAEVIDRNDTSDLVKRWVYDGRSVRSWLVRRVLRPEAQRIEFTHEAPQPPLAAQRGEWNFSSDGNGGTRLSVTHAVEAVEAGALDALAAGLNRNVPAQLRTYKYVAELGDDLERLSVRHVEQAVAAGSVDEVASRLSDPSVWAAIAPGPAVVEARPLTDDADLLSFGFGNTDAPSVGADYVRVRLPEAGVAYKRLDRPAGVHAEVGSWRVAVHAPGTALVRVSGSVTLDVGALRDGLAQARAEQQQAVAASVRRILGRLTAASSAG